MLNHCAGFGLLRRESAARDADAPPLWAAPLNAQLTKDCRAALSAGTRTFLTPRARARVARRAPGYGILGFVKFLDCYYLVLVTVVLGGAMVDFFIQLVTGHQRKLLTQSRTWALLFFLLLLFLVLIASAYFAALANEKCETAV